MMRNIHYLSLAGIALFAASCSNDFDNKTTENGQAKEVVVSLELPARIQTYAYGDGSTVERLHYAVYEHSENGQLSTPIISGEVEDAFANNALTYTQSFTVITGVTYDFVFFADADEENSPYTFDPATATITDTEATENGTITANKEARDAFYGVLTQKITDAFNLKVELKRPFAQLNLGTNDLEADIVKAKFGENHNKLFTSVAVKTYSKLNLLTQEATEPVSVTYGKSNKPEGETFTILNYDYLSMNYLLMNQEIERQNCVFTVYCDDAVVRDITVPNLPLKANFQTNVYGQLLTSDGKIEVVILPEFEGNFDHMEEVAPGLLYSEESKTYGVHSAEGLQALAELPIEASEKVFLNSDIDMAGEPLPMLTTTWHPERPNTFDGNGHTIKNAALTEDNKNFINSWVGSIKNISIEGLTGTVDDRFTGLFGNVYGDIEDIHIKDIKIESTEGRVGAIVGIHNAGAMRNCSLENAEFVGTWSVGGMIGCINETATGRIYENLVVKNVKVTNTCKFGSVFDKMTGIIVGCINVNGVEFVNCTIEGCDSELPIYDTFIPYTWNGTVIEPNIDDDGNPLE